jgi:hypothetical protein
LRDAAPSLQHLSLAASVPDELELPELDDVQSLSLVLPRLPEQPLVLSWPALTSLRFELQETTDAAMIELLSHRPPRLTSLTMRGCPIGDQTLRAAAAIPTLEYLDVVGTNVSEGALAELHTARPTLRGFPRLG